MAFKIRQITGQPDYGTLQAAKIIHYPLEKRDYKPFAQARIAVNETDICMELISFEVEHSPKSCISAVLCLSEEPSAPVVSLDCFADGTVVCTAHTGSEAVDLSAQIDKMHPIQGEDLQGVYWGYDIRFPLETLSALYTSHTPHEKSFAVTPGNLWKGNFFKTCHDPKYRHSGSFFPCDFERPLHDQTQHGEFIIIDY